MSSDEESGSDREEGEEDPRLSTTAKLLEQLVLHTGISLGPPSDGNKGEAIAKHAILASRQNQLARSEESDYQPLGHPCAQVPQSPQSTRPLTRRATSNGTTYSQVGGFSHTTTEHGEFPTPVVQVVQELLRRLENDQVPPPPPPAPASSKVPDLSELLARHAAPLRHAAACEAAARAAREDRQAREDAEAKQYREDAEQRAASAAAPDAEARTAERRATAEAAVNEASAPEEMAKVAAAAREARLLTAEASREDAGCLQAARDASRRGGGKQRTPAEIAARAQRKAEVAADTRARQDAAIKAAKEADPIGHALMTVEPAPPSTPPPPLAAL